MISAEKTAVNPENNTKKLTIIWQEYDITF